MKHISEAAPEILAPYTADLIEFINYPVPRVKWGVSEAIGNISRKYPEKVEGAIPKLLLNTKDASTVVKWCAAYGLTEIAKSNSKTHKQLIPFFELMSKSEKNNGVRNVYLKALKVLQKNK